MAWAPSAGQSGELERRSRGGAREHDHDAARLRDEREAHLHQRPDAGLHHETSTGRRNETLHRSALRPRLRRAAAVLGALLASGRAAWGQPLRKCRTIRLCAVTGQWCRRRTSTRRADPVRALRRLAFLRPARRAGGGHHHCAPGREHAGQQGCRYEISRKRPAVQCRHDTRQ